MPASAQHVRELEDEVRGLRERLAQTEQALKDAHAGGLDGDREGSEKCSSPLVPEIDADVAEQRRAQEALSRSEARLKEALHIARLGSWELEIATGKVWWTEELYRMFGLDPEGPTVSYGEQARLFTEESWSALTTGLDRTVREGVPYELELEAVRPDGSHRWMLARGEAVRDAKGTIVRLSGVALDITERKQAEFERKRVEASVSALLESTDDQIWSVDLDLRLRTFNRGFFQALERIHGVRVVPGMRPEDVLPREIAPKWVKMYEQALNHGPFRTEYSSPYVTCLDLSLNPIIEDSQKVGVSVFSRDISDRKLAEAARQRLEASMTALIESTDEMIWSVDREGRLLAFNQALNNRLQRYQRTQAAIGKRAEEILPPEIAAEMNRMYQRAMTEGAFRQEYVSSYGSILDLSFNPICENGSVVGVSVFSRDITAQKEAETKLRDSEERYRSVVTAMAEGVVLQDAEGKIIASNASGEQILGMFGGDLKSKTSASFQNMTIQEDGSPFPADTYPSMVTLRTGQPQSNVCMGLRKPDGSTTWILINSEPLIHHGSGKPYAVVTTFTDISRRKQTELALQESEARFRVLANFVPQLVWMCHPDGLNFYLNQRWMDYTGLSLEESYGQGWSTPIHPEDKQAAWDAWNHAVATGSIYRIETRLRAGDGTYRWFLVRGIPLKDAAGRITRWFGTCTDIQDLKCAEDQMRKLNEELELRVQSRTANLVAANKELESFNFAIAHDLRGPLRHIHGYAELLVEEASPVLNEAAQGHLRVICESIQRMALLLQELLNLSRVGRHEIQRRRCDLNAVVQRVLTDVKTETRDRKIEWRIAELPIVECDENMMRQAMLNLVSNAVKFTRRREPAVIEIGQTTQDGIPVVFVRDNGEGFDMKYAEKLFGLFQRLHHRQEFEGTGVGLAIVQRIIQKHGGSVWAKAEVNHGATFYFCLDSVGSERQSQELGQDLT